MAEIVLTTLNAKYAHASFGLRYLMANLGELRERARLVEFDINQRVLDIVEGILEGSPRIVGLGVYIWNVAETTEVVGVLKRLRPELVVVVGGPEVSYETEGQEICGLADYVMTGEADLAFGELCGQLLSGRRPLMKVIAARLPEFGEMKLPYEFYTERDLAQRVVYVEASRGCPFKCEFCLSSLDVPVRAVPLERFLEEMGKLIDRGLRQFKFVDRTFNLNAKTGEGILRFFHERYVPGMFLHFEMIPDRLPEVLRGWIAKFPAGALQFEVGIQTFNEKVSGLISRRQDNVKVEENFRYLREQTGVHLHADLIVGLPGEDLESFGAGFDRLVGMRPQEIQVGILKRLRGTPIVRHDGEWGMVYSAHPPYEVLQTKAMDFGAIQRMRRFARYWDLIGNSGNFKETAAGMWEGGVSPFSVFLGLADWIYKETGQTHAIALGRLAELVFRYLTEVRGMEAKQVAESVWKDYQRVGRSDRPEFLRGFIGEDRVPSKGDVVRAGKSRQARHLA